MKKYDWYIYIYCILYVILIYSSKLAYYGIGDQVFEFYFFWIHKQYMVPQGYQPCASSFPNSTGQCVSIVNIQ